jgi:hypothetical protein
MCSVDRRKAVPSKENPPQPSVKAPLNYKPNRCYMHSYNGYIVRYTPSSESDITPPQFQVSWTSNRLLRMVKVSIYNSTWTYEDIAMS